MHALVNGTHEMPAKELALKMTRVFTTFGIASCSFRLMVKEHACRHHFMTSCSCCSEDIEEPEDPEGEEGQEASDAHQGDEQWGTDSPAAKVKAASARLPLSNITWEPLVRWLMLQTLAVCLSQAIILHHVC